VLRLPRRLPALPWPRSRLLASLRASAYAMYVVHYAIVSWVLYALLDLAVPGGRSRGRVRRAMLTERLAARRCRPPQGRASRASISACVAYDQIAVNSRSIIGHCA
jgi:hypothetical protein